MEFDTDIKKELISIIERVNTGHYHLTNREVAMLYHWINHINDIEYSWVPEKYKKDMPQYRGK